MESDKRIGPSCRLDIHCFGCLHCRGVSYTCQGDSGVDYYCDNPQRKVEQNHIGDCRTNTPSWCPVRDEAINNLVEELKRDGAR